MTLSQILIEAGVTPDDLHADCMFIAHDAYGLCSQYKRHPVMHNLNEFMWSVSGIVGEKYIWLELEPSQDWQTPLSREQFISDYEEYNK